MGTDEQKQLGRETVLVQAGVVADVETGQLRSQWLDHHRAMREESMNRDRAARRRKVRVSKAVGWFVIVALPVGGIVYFLTDPGAREVAGQLLADLGMLTDPE